MSVCAKFRAWHQQKGTLRGLVADICQAAFTAAQDAMVSQQSASLLQTFGRAMPTPDLTGSVPPVPLYNSSLDLLGGPGARLTVPPARRIVGTWLKNLQNLLGTLLRHSARKRSRVAQSV